MDNARLSSNLSPSPTEQPYPLIEEQFCSKQAMRDTSIPATSVAAKNNWPYSHVGVCKKRENKEVTGLRLVFPLSGRSLCQGGAARSEADRSTDRHRSEGAGPQSRVQLLAKSLGLDFPEPNADPEP